ncbi:HET-domain-containing protein [Lophium mytilinum]|uniref:HET-domain-containing protein n=1 Tax=Lophium mytilinum TaxID=390894 RepID=A0A6A6QS99_9PEZI|nr:HET-domain-containing protein [Lophium mytilinum]
MADNRVPSFSGAISSSTGLASSTREASRFSQRRPRGLVLRETRAPTPAFDPEEQSRSSHCGICLKSLAQNPQLCEDCQIWNDAVHVFQCLRDTKKWQQLPGRSLRALLESKECMMCRQVATAILSRFTVSDEAVRKDLLKAEVQNMGPYCLGQTALNSLDPAAFQKSGRHSIDPSDLRLPHTLEVSKWETETDEKQFLVVLYLVVTASRGSTLRQTFPEVDGYELMNSTTGSPREKPVLGCHRTIPEGGPGLHQPTIGLQLELKYAHSTSRLLSLKPWECSNINIDLVSKWIRRCRDNHGPKCDLDRSQTSLPRGFKAIDTQRLCVVDLPSQPITSYAALSYTWGGPSGVPELQLERSNITILQEEGSLAKLGGIPSVILDAITLCQSLNEQYLWVDRLCIVQDDPVSKHSQIQAMDRIYNIAAFTIIAATPPGAGLPGVTGHPRRSALWDHTRRFHPKFRFIVDNFKHTVISSFWNTRGWTYQERVLSRRAIYITEFQAYFLCRRDAEQEDVGEFGATVNPWNFHLPAQYFTTVVDYTSRDLSFGSDILNAFAGIGNIFAKEQGAPLIFGLPERFLSQALLWENSAESQKRDEAPGIPSWSWAAWKGRAIYDLNSRVEKLKVGTLVRFYFQDAQHGLRRVDADDAWFFKTVRLESMQDLPAVDNEYPEMRFMPAASDSETAWRKCPHNPWAISSRELDRSIAEQAAKYPGSLVFTTTLATVTLRPQHVGNEDDMEYVEILDQSGTSIGQTSRLHRAYIKDILDTSASHEIIVLSAGILAEQSRYAQTHSILHVSGNMMLPTAGDTPWYLHVMIIQRDAHGIARRLCVGTVEMRRWEQCNPEWCTVFLT